MVERSIDETIDKLNRILSNNELEAAKLKEFQTYLQHISRSPNAELAKAHLRKVIIDMVGLDFLSVEQAEEFRSKNELPAMRYYPPIEEFDPHELSHWSLPMCVAWLLWRTDEKVRLYWDDYRLRCRDWVPNPKTKSNAVLRKLPPTKNFITLIGHYFDKNNNPIMPANKALKKIHNELSKGNIFAEALDTSGEPVTIPTEEWIFLERTAGMNNETNYRLKGRPHDVKYSDIQINREAVLKVWKTVTKPKKQPNKTSNSIVRTRKWLVAIISASPETKLFSRPVLHRTANDKLKQSNHKISEANFQTVWNEVIAEFKADVWSKPGSRASDKISDLPPFPG